MDHKITIGLPVYNRTDYFREALESAINQTVRCPILVVDNNSPHDDFKKIIDEYNDPYIKYVKTDDTVPQDENFNNCFRFADTDWVTVLHDDDMLHTQYVEFCMNILDTYKDQVGGIAYRSFVSDQEWKDINTKMELTDDIKILKYGYHFFFTLVFPGVLVKKDRALEIGGFKSGIFPIADVDFWYRYNVENPVFLAEQELSYYRISESQSTTKVIEKMINNVYRYRVNIMKDWHAYSYLNRLGLEYARIENIDYFKSRYPGLEIDDLIFEKERLDKAKKLLKNKLISRLVFKYMRMVCYKKPKRS